MRWDDAFLTTFAPAAGRAQQAVYDDLRLDRAMAERRERDDFALKNAKVAYDRERSDRLADELRKEKNDSDRLDAELRARSRAKMESLRIADDKVKADSEADRQRLHMEGIRLDAALFDKKVSEYAAGMEGIDDSMLALAGAPLLKKRAAGAPLSLDERAILAAGERVAAARRAPQYEKVVENIYQPDAAGKPTADERGTPIVMGRKEYMRRMQPAFTPAPQPAPFAGPSPAAPAMPAPSGALGATQSGYETFVAARIAEAKRKAEAEAAYADGIRAGVPGASTPAAMWRGPAM